MNLPRIAGAALSALLLALSLSAPRGATPVGAQSPSSSSGAVLAADNFSDPNSGLFPGSSPAPGKWQVGYVNSEYQFAGVDPSDGDTAAITTDATYTDVTVSVNARVDGDTHETVLGIVCRWNAGSSPNGYELSVYPGGSAVTLSKLRFGQRTTLKLLAPDDDLLPGGQLNHLELTCAGRSISASVNGATIGSVQDTSFTRGMSGISIGRFDFGTVSARFSNFALTQP